jgi:hypothetical protein
MLSNTLAEIIIIGVFVIWIAQNFAYRRRNWLDYPLFKPIVAIIGFNAIILIASGYEGGFGAVFELLALPVFYFVVPSIVVTAERRRKIVWLLIGGAIVAASVGIIQFYLDLHQHTASAVSGDSTLAIYLALILGIVLSLLVYTPGIKEKLFINLVSIPLFVGILLTFSRACYLATAIFSLGLAIFKDGRLLMLLIVIAGISYLYSPQVISYFKDNLNITDVDSIFSQRELLDEIEKLTFTDIPFFGSGINSILKETNSDNVKATKSQDSMYRHNMYIETLRDCGPLALVFLFWLLFAQIWYSFTRFRKSKESEQKMYQLSFIILLFTFMLIGLFSNNFRDPVISTLFWFYLGLSVI